MVARSSFVTVVTAVTGALAISVAAAATGCGALIGIADGVPDPGLGDATTNGDATTTIDGAARADAAMTDASTTPDATVPRPIAKPGGDTTSLPCGGMTCAIPTESCCAYRSTMQQGVYTGVCATTCAPPSGNTDRVSALKCSGASNCPGTAPRCCYHVTQSGTVETSCQTSCGFTDVMLCDPDVPSSCGSQRFCQHFTGQTMPPSWGYCN